MKIPFVDLRAQYYTIKKEIDQAILDVIQESAFIGGKFVKSFEQKFANFIGAKHCIGVGNGTDAIYIALRALGISEGDEVLTAANSFIATSEAITLTGAAVKFVDCEKDTYNIDPEKIEHLITNRTKAIIPVHLYGQPADMDRIKKIAANYQLFIVEDAAQAHGAEYKGQKIGTIGDMTCFSFYPGKNLGAYGDAGAIITNDDNLAKKARMIANHGRMDKYNHEIEGVNSRLDGFQAAILDVKLRHYKGWVERRIEIAKQYDEALKDLLPIPKTQKEMLHVYHLYVTRVKNREKVQKYLLDKDISTGIHYPIPLPFLKAYDHLNYSISDIPLTSQYSKEILSLPIYPELLPEQVEYVCAQLKAALQS